DSGNGHRLERYGQFVLSRPDPQAIWLPCLPSADWNSANAKFLNDKWQTSSRFPKSWNISYHSLTFKLFLTSFKHTGLFPEQHLHWDFISGVIAGVKENPLRVLNLFGYTGAASLAAVKAGARVTHVDASRSAIAWAKENQALCGFSDTSIRWIVDDALTFVSREIRRGVRYDGIIMDPPVYGHGPNKEIWDFSRSFPKLLSACKEVLSPAPLFVIANAYAISSSAIMLGNLFEDQFNSLGGKVEYGELAIEEKSRKRLLSTGIFAKWHV
ncbi:MAG: class I SAM-dependent methyltransferase, partial [Patescibacteria group bacterium]